MASRKSGDTSKPCDLSSQFSHLSTQPSETSTEQKNQSRDSCKPEIVTKPTVTSTKPSTSSIPASNKPDRPQQDAVIDFTPNMLKNITAKTSTKINVKLPSDVDQPSISGCCFMPGGGLILCDSANYKVKLFDTSLVLKDSLVLDKGPRDVAVVDASNVVVTLPDGEILQFIQVIPSLKKDRTISVSIACYGIDIANDQIFISAIDYDANDFHGEIRIYDMSGNLKRRINKDQYGTYLFQNPFNIAVTQVGGRILVSDESPATLSCLTADGKVVFQNKLRVHETMTMSMIEGVHVLENGDVIVCDCFNNNIRLVPATATDVRKKPSVFSSPNGGVKNPLCIAFRPSDGMLAVGCGGNNNLYTFKMS